MKVSSLKGKVATGVLTVLLGIGMPGYARSSQPEIKSYAMPDWVAGIKSHALNLNGTWDFKLTAASKWTQISVPGEVAMQGFAPEHDKTVFYKRSFQVPKDFAGQKMILRFDGVYSHARLRINGRFVREHKGGFTRWETDVTSLLTPGKKNVVELEVIDPLNDISYASGYAHHPVCGILRDVVLYAVPQASVSNVKVETRLDSTYTNADYILTYTCDADAPATKMKITLFSPDGQPVFTKQAAVTKGQNELTVPVLRPQKWDAEHPRLYKQVLELEQDGRTLATYTRQIGFRDIKVVGNRLLVNGSPVKLRGACRHDIHPDLGRATTRETDSLDAVLFKEANMNFVRTSHYPPTERFIEFCDRYGIYVECETAVCFVNTYRQSNYAPGASQDDSTHTGQYLGQVEEMVRSFGSHASVLFWSIGNESCYGENFQKSYDLAKRLDHTRPIIFSYPGSVPAERKPIYELLSMHYNDVNGNLWQWGKQTTGFQGEGIPALFDEWAHPACYTYQTLQHDPGIREFWGKSLDMMWNGVYNAPGALGGAIWGYVDERFMLPEPKEGKPYWIDFAHTGKPEAFKGNCVGYGDWGIVDIWRRKKPEFWATKKAYSPIRVEHERNIRTAAGMPLYFTVFNRFDHTRLDEVVATAEYKNEKMVLQPVTAAPHERGTLCVPAREWQQGESLYLKFTDKNGNELDSYRFVIGERKVDYPQGLAGNNGVTVKETGNTLLVEGNGLSVPFDKETGLIQQATLNGRVIIEKGPFFNAYVNFNHLTGAEVRKISNHIEVNPTDWKKQSLTWKKTGENVEVLLSGNYKDVRADFTIRISGKGGMDISYAVNGLPNGYLRETGVVFRLPDTWQSLSWEREGYWDSYPAESMSGDRGTTPLYNKHVPAYGKNPKQAWHMDTHDYYYWADRGTNAERPLTVAAKAMKENIYVYTLSQKGASLSAVSPAGQLACRINKPQGGELLLYLNNRWDYPEIAWGNYCKVISALPCHGQINLVIER